MRKQAIIIGAGPAGLTAALELLRRTDIHPVILEASGEIGGISRTIRYKGNRMDIGGHRFFSKSDRVMQWWMDLMPPELATRRRRLPGDPDHQLGRAPSSAPSASPPPHPKVLRGEGTADTGSVAIDTDTDETGPTGHLHPSEHGHTHTAVMGAPDPEDPDLDHAHPPPQKPHLLPPQVLRLPHQAHRLPPSEKPRQPPAPSASALSYLRNPASPRSRPKKASKTSSSIASAASSTSPSSRATPKRSGAPSAIRSPPSGEPSASRASASPPPSSTSSARPSLRTSPRRHGRRPEEAPTPASSSASCTPSSAPASSGSTSPITSVKLGGEIHMGWQSRKPPDGGEVCPWRHRRRNHYLRRRAQGLHRRLLLLHHAHAASSSRRSIDEVPANVREVSDGLQYRDFITVGLLADQSLKVHRARRRSPQGHLDLRPGARRPSRPPADLQQLEPASSSADPRQGLDRPRILLLRHRRRSGSMEDVALQELRHRRGRQKIGILDAARRHSTPTSSASPRPTQPTSAPTSASTSSATGPTPFDNLFLVGRNGMHKYNNQDHSMLTAMTAVDGIVSGRIDKAALWGINTEQDYHEEKK